MSIRLNKIRVFTISLLLVLVGQASPVQVDPKPLNVDAALPSWDELANQWRCPEWFRDAKFGIWAHWGPQSQPSEGTGWYAKWMYCQTNASWGASAYPYHVKTYGHPSKKGYKDVIHAWKAEKFDPDGLMKFYKDNGAKFFWVTACHHDHFDNFDSSYQPWNSVNMGPKRDIVGDYEKAARKYGLKFGIASHDNRFPNWMTGAFGADAYGPLKGVPYDGYLTKEDGKGTWWEGYDPADLYGLPPEKRTPEYLEKIKKIWMLRHLELVNKYKPDMLWFDSWDIPYGQYGLNVVRTFYANSLKKEGRINVFTCGKHRQRGTVLDIERGGSDHLETEPWVSMITFTSWFYKEGVAYRHNTRTILETLIDVVSKNGCLLLTAEQRGDGTVPDKQRKCIREVGQWLNENGDAIYGTRPWHQYGDGSSLHKIKSPSGMISEANQSQKKIKYNFNERTVASPPYAPDEVRFTTRGKQLYVIILNPAAGTLKVSALKKGEQVGSVTAVRTHVGGKKLTYQQVDEGFVIDIPQWCITTPNRPLVLEVDGVIR